MSGRGTPGSPVAALLAGIAAGRGYVLPHHRFLAEHAPAALAAYDELYRAITLRPAALGAADRERVWLSLLAVRRKFSWKIHLERARSAGLTDDDVAECVALAALAEGRGAVAHALAEWAAAVSPAALVRVEHALFEAARGRMPAGTAHLALAVCHAARTDAAGIRAHLPQALASGVSPAGAAEALSFLLLECGANALIEAVGAWNAAAATGECPPPYRADSP